MRTCLTFPALLLAFAAFGCSKGEESPTAPLSDGSGAPGSFQLFNLKDRETGSIWNFKGKAVSGPLEGETLRQLPAHNAMWFAWLAFWGNTGVHGSEGIGDGRDFLNQIPFPLNDIYSGGVPRDGIPALTDPRLDAASEAQWADTEAVFGVVVNGEARAYPHAIGWWHEIVNDVVGGKPICVTFCPLTGTGMVFDGVSGAGGNRITLGVSGLLFNSNLIMFDRRDGVTHYPQMIYESINGDVGQELELLPVIETTWGLWQQLYPETKVVSRRTGISRNYSEYPYGSYRANQSIFYPLAQDIVENALSELHHPKERVLGIRGELGTPRAYPFTEMGGVQAALNETLDNRDILIVYYQDGRLAIPYSREVNGNSLTFDIDQP